MSAADAAAAALRAEEERLYEERSAVHSRGGGIVSQSSSLPVTYGRGPVSLQTLTGSFSALPKPIFAGKCSLETS